MSTNYDTTECAFGNRMQVFEHIAELHRRKAPLEERSLKKLAEKAGIDRRTLHQLIRAKAFQCKVLGLLARAVELSGDDLLRLLDEMPMPEMQVRKAKRRARPAPRRR